MMPGQRQADEVGGGLGDAYIAEFAVTRSRSLDDRRDDRRLGRPEEEGHRRDEERDDVDEADVDLEHERHGQHEAGADEVAGDHRPPPVPSVDERAGQRARGGRSGWPWRRRSGRPRRADPVASRPGTRAPPAWIRSPSRLTSWPIQSSEKLRLRTRRRYGDWRRMPRHRRRRPRSASAGMRWRLGVGDAGRRACRPPALDGWRRRARARRATGALGAGHRVHDRPEDPERQEHVADADHVADDRDRERDDVAEQAARRHEARRPISVRRRKWNGSSAMSRLGEAGGVKAADQMGICPPLMMTASMLAPMPTDGDLEPGDAPVAPQPREDEAVGGDVRPSPSRDDVGRSRVSPASPHRRAQAQGDDQEADQRSFRSREPRAAPPRPARRR